MRRYECCIPYKIMIVTHESTGSTPYLLLPDLTLISPYTYKVIKTDKFDDGWKPKGVLHVR